MTIPLKRKTHGKSILAQYRVVSRKVYQGNPVFPRRIAYHNYISPRGKSQISGVFAFGLIRKLGYVRGKRSCGSYVFFDGRLQATQ